MANNFLQWNPNGANQETDSAYASDAQRSGGAAVGAGFPSATANKLFYQLSTGMAALMQMMATKGYSVLDSNLNTLAGVLAAIQTTADIKGLLTSLAWSSTITCDASKFNGFQIVLNGNTTIVINNPTPGQILSFQFQQGGSGSYTVTWPSNFYGAPALDPLTGSYTLLSFEIGTDNAGRVFTPGMSVTQGLVGTPIGRQAAQDGTFTNLTATGPSSFQAVNSASESVSGGVTAYNLQANNQTTTNILQANGLATLAQLIVNTSAQVASLQVTGGGTVAATPAITDSTTNIANTNWVHNLLATVFNPGGTLVFGTASKGHIQFPAVLGGLIIQWGNVLMPGSGSSDNPTGFSFDISFNHILGIIATTFSGSTLDRITYVYNVTNAGGTMSNNGSGANATYIAIGY